MKRVSVSMMLRMDTAENKGKPHIAVIGAGITGLSAAHRLVELGGVDVEIFEAGPEPGGLLKTEHHGDHLIECGADSFITNKPAALDLCLRLGLESELIQTNEEHRRSLVLRDGKPVPVPRGFQLLMPTQTEPLMQSSILSDAGKQRVLEEANIPPKPRLEDESVASFVRRRFGDELFERLAQPMVGGIYTADPEKLSLLATLPRFLHMEQEHGSLTAAAAATKQEAASGARYGLFVSLRRGIGQLTRTLVERIEASHTIHRNTPIRAMSGTRTGWLVHPASSESIEFDGVIVATSAWRAADLLREETPDLSSSLGEIEYASSAVVYTAHRLSDIEHAMDAFGLVIPETEGRRVLAVSFASRKFDGRCPDDQIILRSFVGGALNPLALQHTDDQIVNNTLDELASIFGIKGKPLRANVTRYERAMPQYHLGHVDRVTTIREQLASIDRLQIAGNAYDGVGIPDSVRNGETAAEAMAINLH